MTNPICECGHTRTQHSRGGGCLAMIRKQTPLMLQTPLVPEYRPCTCSSYTVDAERYTIGQLEQIREAGKDHV